MITVVLNTNKQLRLIVTFTNTPPAAILNHLHWTHRYSAQSVSQNFQTQLTGTAACCVYISRQGHWG